MKWTEPGQGTAVGMAQPDRETGTSESKAESSYNFISEICFKSNLQRNNHPREQSELWRRTSLPTHLCMFEEATQAQVEVSYVSDAFQTMSGGVTYTNLDTGKTALAFCKRKHPPPQPRELQAQWLSIWGCFVFAAGQPQSLCPQ